ncbi:MAG: hypothetical protein AB1545_05700 [Thermodesulfobacteriota bacterium]
MKITYWQRTSAITVSAFLLLGISEGSADAASVSANAEMSWASLQITGTGSASVFIPDAGTWKSSWSRAGAYAQWTIPADPYKSSDLRSGIVVTLAESEMTTAFGEAYALARTDTVPGEKNIIAAASAFATNYEDFSAIATAQRDIYYQVDKSGSLTFSINYTLDSISIDAADGSGWADILAFTNLTRYNATTGNWDKIRAGYVTKEKVTDLIEFDDYIYGPKSGTITFSYTATAGQLLHFGAGVMAKASAASAVPVPGAVWLLGSGLLGLIAIRRKSTN